MPTYSIKGPDGKIYEIDGPAGATREEVIARVKAKMSAAPAAPERSFGQDLLRTAGLGARDLALGATDALGIVGNPINYLTSKATGNPYRSMSDEAGLLLDKFGLPSPETDQERTISDVDRAIVGAMGMGGAGRALASAPGKIGMVGEGMAANPGLQGAGAVTGTLAAGAVRDVGGGFIPQLFAGLAGGMVPGGAMAAGRAASTASRVLSDRYTVPGAERRAAQHILESAERPGAIAPDGPPQPQDTRGFFQRTKDMVMGVPAPSRPYTTPGEPSDFPDYTRSLASETQDPGLYPLERKMRNDFPNSGWTERDIANNAAHIRAITGFAGDEQSLARLVKLRKDATEPLRKAARRLRGVDSKSVINLLKRELKENEGATSIVPTLEKLLADLQRRVPPSERKRTALDALQSFIDSRGSRPTADHDAALEAMKQIRRGEAPTGAFSTQAGQEALVAASKAHHGLIAPEDRVRILDNVRREIGLMLSGKYGGDSGMALKNSAELMKIKTRLDKALETGSPEMKLYLDTFREMSKPINRQEVGQYYMSEKAGGAVPDANRNQVLLPAPFTKLVRRPNATAAAATGFKKAKSADILEPGDSAILKSIAEDLRRRNEVTTKASGGNSLTDQFSETGRKMFSSAIDNIPWLGGVSKFFGTVGDKRMQAVVNQMMQNPARARAIINSLNVSEQRRLAAARRMQDYSTLGSGAQSALLTGRTGPLTEEEKRDMGRVGW